MRKKEEEELVVQHPTLLLSPVAFTLLRFLLSGEGIKICAQVPTSPANFAVPLIYSTSIYFPSFSRQELKHHSLEGKGGVREGRKSFAVRSKMTGDSGLVKRVQQGTGARGGLWVHRLYRCPSLSQRPVLSDSATLFYNQRSAIQNILLFVLSPRPRPPFRVLFPDCSPLIPTSAAPTILSGDTFSLIFNRH